MQPLRKNSLVVLCAYTCTWSFVQRSAALSYMLKEIENRSSNKYLYTNVHGNTIHFSQKVEMTHTPAHGRVGRQKVVTHTMKYYSTVERCKVRIYTTM